MARAVSFRRRRGAQGHSDPARHAQAPAL